MIITKDSHLDHGLTAAHIALITDRFASKEAPFFIETVTIPVELPALLCDLYGPLMGDASVAETDVTYAVRGSRPCASRLVVCPKRSTLKLTIVGGMHEGQCILFTAYGGPVAPREPFDSSLSPEEKVASEAFWAEHALAVKNLKDPVWIYLEEQNSFRELERSDPRLDWASVDSPPQTVVFHISRSRWNYVLFGATKEMAATAANRHVLKRIAELEEQVVALRSKLVRA